MIKQTKEWAMDLFGAMMNITLENFRANCGSLIVGLMCQDTLRKEN